MGKAAERTLGMGTGLVKSFTGMLVPVDLLLMDGCIFCIKRASVMENLLWLYSVRIRVEWLNILCYRIRSRGY